LRFAVFKLCWNQGMRFGVRRLSWWKLSADTQSVTKKFI